MAEQVSFIPYSVVAAAMSQNHRLAGGLILEKTEPPLRQEWVQPTQLSIPSLKDHQPEFVFTAKAEDGGTWKVTMFPLRPHQLSLGWADVGNGGIAEHTPPTPPKPRVQRATATPAM
jgi:hypothetical protein